MNIGWVLATVLGLLTSVFLVDRYLGVSAVVLSAMVITILYRYRKQNGMVIGRRFHLMGVYMLLLSGVLMTTTVPVIRFWTCVILSVLSLGLSICEQRFVWPVWVKEGLIAFFGGVSRMGTYFTAGKNLTSNGRKQVGHIFLGILISIPILAVAAVLLSSADEIMATYLGDFFEGLFIDDAGIWIVRIIVFVIVASVTYGLSQWLGREKLEKEIKESVDVEVIPPVLSGTILFLLNILYLFFAYVQFRFLFLGAVNVQMTDYDYAEYARSGFFELVVLTILNTVGILVINRFTKSHLFNRLSLTVTALCTFVMMVSSWYKMYLYEQAYGYTQLRLYVYLILAFMFVFMALITIGVWRRDYRVVEWAMIIGLSYYLVIAYINIDGIIVDNNMARYQSTGEIDLYYLMTELSEDAVPKLARYLEEDPDLYGVEIHEVYRYDRWDEESTYDNNDGDILTTYNYMKTSVLNQEYKRQFFEFNLRHWLAERAVE